MNPRVIVDLSKLDNNIKVLKKMCSKNQINKIAGVTKSFCGNEIIANQFVKSGIDYLADSRIENLKRLQSINVPKVLLRLPMLSQVEDVIKYSDISLNSEYITLEKLNQKALELGLTHKVVLMYDLGDLREGIYDKAEFLKLAQSTDKLSNIELIGIGTNLTCYGGVMPSKANLSELCDIAKEIEEIILRPLEIISGGNSSSIHMLSKNEIPSKINNLRLGESIILGVEAAYGSKIEGCYQDAFKLSAELIEIQDKPSIPKGNIGMDAFGNKPSFIDYGIRKRGILAIGKQDFGGYELFPEIDSIKILGASSDHLIVDITDVKEELKIGSEIKFRLKYGALLSLMTSEYVKKEFIN